MEQESYQVNFNLQAPFTDLSTLVLLENLIVNYGFTLSRERNSFVLSSPFHEKEIVVPIETGPPGLLLAQAVTLASSLVGVLN